jgi:hypothetical protein
MLLYLAGAVAARSFVYLGAAAAAGVLASLLWSVVEAQRDRPAAAVNPAAWLAFPLALLLFFAELPLLLLAVYPPIADYLAPESPVRAYYVERTGGLRLEIAFPRSIEAARRGNNLRLDDRLVPPELFEEHRELFEWRDDRTLSLAIEEIEALLGLAPVETVSVNADAQAVLQDSAAWPFRFEEGGRVQPVTVRVGAAPVRARPARP